MDLGIWTPSLKNKLIAAGGSVQRLDEVPEELKALYKTVWEISQRSLIDMAADRGAFIDQSQSFNVHIGEPSFAKLTSMHFYAWKKGLKTGMYYLRTKPAADAIQFTVDPQLAALKADAASDSAPVPASPSKQATTPSTTPQSTPTKTATTSPFGGAVVAGEVCTMQEGCLSCGS